LSDVDVSGLRGKTCARNPRDLQLMFQDPHASLDPGCGSARSSRAAGRCSTSAASGRQRMSRLRRLLDEVGLPRNAVERYPHEFSGGQRQRIGLARALMLNPKVIVADEPVSALDVSIRSQVLNLMKRLQAEHGLTYVVISHDLAVVKYLADRIGVMYLGKLVELGTGDDIYERARPPLHRGLIATIPVPDPAAWSGPRSARRSRASCRARSIPPSGCRFRTRCPLAQEQCAAEEPSAAVVRSRAPGGLSLPAADSGAGAGGRRCQRELRLVAL
jgi:peptide/nickel transport system ATP-binding protein